MAAGVPADVRELFRQCPFREVRMIVLEGSISPRPGEVSKCFAIDTVLGFPAGSVGVHESTCAVCVSTGQPGSLDNAAFKADVDSAATARIGSGACPQGVDRDIVIAKALVAGTDKERLRLALIRGVKTAEKAKALGRTPPNPLTEEEAMRLAVDHDLLSEVAR